MTTQPDPPTPKDTEAEEAVQPLALVTWRRSWLKYDETGLCVRRGDAWWVVLRYGPRRAVDFLIRDHEVISFAPRRTAAVLAASPAVTEPGPELWNAYNDGYAAGSQDARILRDLSAPPAVTEGERATLAERQVAAIEDLCRRTEAAGWETAYVETIRRTLRIEASDGIHCDRFAPVPADPNSED